MPAKQTDGCKHVWAYQHLEYERGPLIDGLTHEWHRLFFNVYHCVHCLELTRVQTFIRNSTAGEVIAGARPAPLGTWEEMTGEEGEAA